MIDAALRNIRSMKLKNQRFLQKFDMNTFFKSENYQTKRKRSVNEIKIKIQRECQFKCSLNKYIICSCASNSEFV